DRKRNGGVAESTGDTDIDHLLRAQSEIDSTLRQHKTHFTVLFTDIVGSTAFFDRYGDTAGLLMLERHNELVLPAIEEAGGTVVKTIGDAVMAFFSSPLAAVRTAVKIQQNLEAYNEDRPRDERIYTRVGLNSGRGYVKARDVFGDVVNVAARMVKACCPAQILITRSVYEGIENREKVTCRKLGSAAFHGKSAGEEIFEVLWTSPEQYQRLRRQLDGEAGPTSRSVLGRYEILDELGQGAMGVVYKAYDPTVRRIVAVKTVRLAAGGAEREELVRRLRQEAQAAGQLEHPNIVTIYDAGEAEGMFYLTMQFVKGPTLAELMRDRALLPVKQILLLMDQVCEGLHYAHERGIVHRDLKPSNILVARDGLVKIVDFGIAKIVEVGTTKAGAILGTPSYMSPEQAQGGRVDRRSDIFSLGTMLYEVLTGEKAFPGNTPTAIIYKIVNEEPIPPRMIEPGIEPGLEKVVRKALTKNPLARYQTCREMQADLKAARTPAPARPVPAPASVPAPAPKPKRRPLAAVLALLLWASVGFLGWRQGWVPVELLLPTSPSPPAGAEKAGVGTSGPAQAPPAVSPIGEKAAGDQSTGGAEAAGKDNRAGAPGKLTDTATSSSKPAAQKEPAQKPGVPATPPAAGRTQPSGAKEAATGAKAPTVEAETKARQAKKPSRRARPTQLALTPEQEHEVKQWLALAEQYNGKGQYESAAIALEKVLSIE
ncbi:MAG: protein kinase, partial [Terriglobia bacterium]